MEALKSGEIKIKEAALNSVASSIMNITQGIGAESISNLDNMSTIDGNKASINSYDEIRESLKNIGSAMLSTSRNIGAVGYSFKGYDVAASNVFKSSKN